MFEELTGARVLLTGNTGFKGAWYTKFLNSLNIEVVGLSLPNSDTGLFNDLGLGNKIKTHFVNILDEENVRQVVQETSPDFIIHFAAQALVIDSYVDPILTFQTNAIGTANVLQAASESGTNRGTLIITTDKVYLNDERGLPFREDAALGGDDPYSSSKACAELITRAWRSATLNANQSNIVTARSGNVIGGGDTSSNRLVPDFIKAFKNGQIAEVRNPYSIRPWQHVLDPLMGYTKLLNQMSQNTNKHFEYNFGPKLGDDVSVSRIADMLTHMWGGEAKWRSISTEHSLPEAKVLKLDSTRALSDLRWQNALSIEDALQWVVDWEKSMDKVRITESQIESFKLLCSEP